MFPKFWLNFFPQIPIPIQAPVEKITMTSLQSSLPGKLNILFQQVIIFQRLDELRNQLFDEPVFECLKSGGFFNSVVLEKAFELESIQDDPNS